MKRAMLFFALAALSAGTRADRLPMPADAPPAFKAECGSCHLAFPPALLAADRGLAPLAGLLGLRALVAFEREPPDDLAYNPAVAGPWPTQ